MNNNEEHKRLETLKEYEIMDSLPEEEYDNITSLASRICGTPISLITLLDQQRQWFKSATGLDIRETPIEYAFCSYAVQNPSEIMVVPDSRKDARFANNPFVVGEPHIVFYAGMPLVTEEGHALGSLCVLDIQEHTLTPFQLTALKQLAKQVVSFMTLQKRNKALKKTVEELAQQNAALKEEIHTLRAKPSA